jgi:carbon-monoxide dehydrogenase small subunit
MSRWVLPGEPLRVALTLNGEERSLDTHVRATLADAVRAQGLTGTHLGCEHGVCGACTVLLDGDPVRACLVLAAQAAGRRVDTVEALGTPESLHPAQEALLRARGLQCGFCTPGIAVLSAWLREREPDADEARVREVLSSSLCRCTGYGPIVDAARGA